MMNNEFVFDFVPMNSDVLITHVDINEAEKNVIHLIETLDKNENQYFKVLAVSPNVNQVSVGDTVLIPWKRITPPFTLKDKSGTDRRVAVTSDKEILAVVE